MVNLGLDMFLRVNGCRRYLVVSYLVLVVVWRYGFGVLICGNYVLKFISWSTRLNGIPCLFCCLRFFIPVKTFKLLVLLFQF